MKQPSRPCHLPQPVQAAADGCAPRSPGAMFGPAPDAPTGANPAGPQATFINQSPRVVAQRKWRDALDHSARIAAQRRTAEAMTRPTARTGPLQTPGGVVQRVRGGIEYTEDGPTALHAYNTKPFTGNVAARNNFAVGAAGMTGFRVGAGIDPNATLDDWTNNDLDVLQSSANVKLTNDVESAEWIIERHHADVPAATIIANLKADITHMFQARDALASAVNSLQSGHAAGKAAIATGGVADTNAAPAVFIYEPGPKKGKAQITAQFSSQDTIRRINKLNVSKYLTGTKVAPGEDIARVSGTASQALINADVQGTTSFSTAEVLLTALRGASQAIPLTAAGGDRLSQAQVGVVKLMVINDAMATTMVRYKQVVGQGQEKNIQRFFPKSRRDEYVKAVAQADLDAGEMAALRTEILRTSAADAQRVFDRADPGALRTDEAFNELGAGHADMAGMLEARRRLALPALGVAAPADLLNIKTAVLGANGALLATWIDRAADAYTAHASGPEFHDPAKADRDQRGNDRANYGLGGGGDVGKVIETSRGFTPVPAGERGAIYEMREREIAIDKSGYFNIGSLDEIHSAIERIFGAA